MHFQNVASYVTRERERERGTEEIRDLQLKDSRKFLLVSIVYIHIQVIVSGLNTHLRDFDA